MQKIKQGHCFILFVVGIGIGISLFSCKTFPKPTEEKNSLIVVLFTGIDERQTQTDVNYTDAVELEGPEEISITNVFGPWNVKAIPVKPGTYKIRSRTVSVSWRYGYRQHKSMFLWDAIVVPENSIVLVPYVFEISLYGWNINYHSTRDYKMNEQQRKKISEELSDTIGFSEWIGKLFIGFGQYTPRMSLKKDEYRLRILSEPAGAEVIVDNEIRGKTPTTTDALSGKHLIEVRKEGFSTWRNYIDVDSDNEVSITLKTVEEVKKEGGQIAEVSRNQYSLLVTPFVNLGNPDAATYQNVFHESLGATLSQDKRIVVLKTPENVPKEDNRSKTMKPDFSLATKSGADLMVAGDFLIEREDLLIHASLFDVQKESAKASILYSSKTGFSIFDSIDDMTKEFVTSVDKVLPETGRTILERKEVVQTEITSLEKKVSVKDVIEKRSLRKHDFSLNGGFGSSLDWIKYNAVTEGSYRSIGASFLASIGYTYHFSTLFGLSAILSLSTVAQGVPENLSDYEQSGGVDTALLLGPEFCVSGQLTEVYLRLLGQYKKAYSQSLKLKSTQNTIEETGEFTFYGITIDAGTRLYLYRRFSSLGWYFNIGARYSPLLYREGEKEPNKERILVPQDAFLYLGLGVRL